QGIENGSVVFRDAGIELDDVGSWNLDEFREGAILIDADDAQILADVGLADTALMAMAAVDVHLGADKIAGLHCAHFVSHALHNPAKFMAQRHGRLDAALRPAIPAVDVQIGATDGSGFDAYQYVGGPNGGHGGGLK